MHTRGEPLRKEAGRGIDIAFDSVIAEVLRRSYSEKKKKHLRPF